MRTEYQFREIEKQWQSFWEANNTFQANVNPNKPKYYVLDMFPYPSGAGLHVGHPLGYIASDIISRYKRLQGFEVLHPMGFDSFGLPAEQYAIQTGQHPALTTEQNIARYIEQLKNMGFSFDWTREVRTSDPSYYKWTQWIFMQLFNSWYNHASDKAESIDSLIQIFEKSGSIGVQAVCDEEVKRISAEEWNAYSEEEKYAYLLAFRLAFLDDSVVNWCPALGTVLANDEVKDGVSERGGHPVEQKKMRQWSMRITAYADRLLRGLEEVDWSDSLKEQQRNWIGKSIGAEVDFDIDNPALSHKKIKVFTTRVDTIYGVSFMVLAPEHEWVEELTTPDQKEAVEAYVTWAKSRSELDRVSEVKQVSGVFTGSFVINPFNGERVPIYLADYVLAGYGTGAVMGVPSGDQRDWNFATHFNLSIIPILDAQKDIEKQADATKEGKYINSELINGKTYQEATPILTAWLEEKGIGKAKIQYRMRNAVFSRQRYWGEPVPVYFKPNSKGDLLPYLIQENELPLELPKIDKYLPTETGEPPLGRAADAWKYQGQYDYEWSTMPGWAGSSWYWYRYMDAKNDQEFASKEAVNYWKAVDLYIGGSEHATGHLLYSRFWNKFLKDLGYVQEEEFAKKLINQGMIQGRSNFVYRVKNVSPATFVSHGLKDQYDVAALHVDVNIVENDILNVEAFKSSRNDVPSDAVFVLEDGKYVCGWEVEKMSKSKYNVVNPDDLIAKYGADTLRVYEMFLGPLEQFKPWNTNSISGSHNFLRKVWRLFFDETTQKIKLEDAPAKPEELKVLHTAIRKVHEDLERYSFNTVVSTLMICVNDLTQLKCHKKAILKDVVLLLSPYAPHMAEELWLALGEEAGSISQAKFPEFNAAYLVEDEFNYPISFNGKVKLTLSFSATASPAEVEAGVLAHAQVQKVLDGQTPSKIIVVPKRIVNIVMAK
ncbi:leucine--tRNA ligase [Aquirufa aurantiipilula]|uniref:Leucine--tRNA ligase n=1 Tax=Aquirufa aurantiipilula TaxID=2696561 RepID=A0ABT6BM80_9BACT|nr:leucine--tRNA ligase [Aquirufa aurantiipilula]MDF5691474.1 leucine--tRNA ligase [Aquirufa aurantiipilula]